MAGAVVGVGAALSCSILAIVAAETMGFFRRGSQFAVDGRTVVITGGSQGMGRSVAKLLAQKGANIVIVAQDGQKLQAAVEYISAVAVRPQSQRFHFISADLRNPEETERIIKEVTAWNNGNPADVVWCCAGHCLPGFFIDTPIETLRGQMDTVYWSAAYMAHSTLRSWLAPRKDSKASTDSTPSPTRHLVFTSSTLAFFSVTGYTPYSPPKAAMRSLSDTLSQELQMYNGSRRNKNSPGPAADVKIHTVFPMGISSPGFENEQKMKPGVTQLMEEEDKPQTPDEVAAAAVKGLEKGEYLVTTMLIGKIMKGTALGGSPKNNIVTDTLMSWLSSLAFLWVVPDLNGKAFKWGREKGVEVKE